MLYNYLCNVRNEHLSRNKPQKWNTKHGNLLPKQLNAYNIARKSYPKLKGPTDYLKS